MINDINDEVILAARLLLATLFLIFGWRKLRDYSGTVSQMVQLGAPMPVAGCCRSDLHGASGCVRGRCWRVRASFGLTYVFLHAGNRAYWASLLDNDRCGAVDSMDGFYKNLSIMGGFLLLYITGAGKYSIDVLCGIAAP